MSTFNQLKMGLEQVWENLGEGWHQLYNRASQALTKFVPTTQKSQLETVDEQVSHQGSRWGLLAAEVLESDNEILVKIEIPGMSADDFNIGVVDETLLVISGEKRVQRQGWQGHYHYMECAYGQFQRTLPLPVPVDESQAKAKYEQGVLRISFPKTAASRKRFIKVNSDE
jgi:HSP20 family protein